MTNVVEDLEFRRVGQNQFEVDDDLRLVVKNATKPLNLFGIGLGYSIKTTNKHIKAEKNLNSRADGVRLYVSIVPYILSSSLAPKRLISKGLKINGMNTRATSMQRVSTYIIMMNIGS